jgi:hypothetical protein
MKWTKQDKRIVGDMILLLVGIIPLVVTQAMPLWFLLFTFVAYGLEIICLIDIFLAIENKPFPTFKKLRKNQTAIIYHWAIGGITIIFMGFIWMIISYPMDLLYQFDIENYPFPITVQNNVTLIHTLTTWFLFFVIIGVGIYVLVNSFRQPNEGY